MHESFQLKCQSSFQHFINSNTLLNLYETVQDVLKKFLVSRSADNHEL